ncbi:MAG: hypothetical protein ABEI86_06990, partial [Halobacteriaceae archaeon]
SPSAREQAYDSGEDDSKAINSSVVGELMYWLENEDMDNEKILILFEKGIFQELGSVVTGKTEVTGIDYEVIPNED